MALDEKYAMQLVIFYCVCTTVGLLLYHPFFQIRNIGTTGFQRMDQEEFVSTVQGAIDYRTFFILPKKNFFLFDAEELKTNILARFPADAIHIETTFPGTFI